MTKIGIALGGGGAKGLAHIHILEVFEELGIRPKKNLTLFQRQGFHDPNPLSVFIRGVRANQVL